MTEGPGFIQIDQATLGNAVTNFGVELAAIQKDAVSIAADMGDLRRMWTGAASNAFYGAYERWDAGLRSQMEIFEMIIDSLAQHGQMTRQTEQELESAISAFQLPSDPVTSGSAIQSTIGG